jgi:DNA-binding response OmpR family regulator
MNILLVEDNNNLALNITEYFEDKGYVVDYSANGLLGLNLALSHRFDVIVLDLMLPGLDGFNFCKQLRDSSHGNTPVIMLTAMDTEQNKLTGFNVGADDYLVKPFSLRELEARILAIVRRSKPQPFNNKHLIYADLDYDVSKMKLRRGGQALSLKPVPLKILVMLMQNPDRVVTREEIELEVWNDDLPDSEVLRSHIYAIRSEINKHGRANILQTIRGIGYMLGGDD